MVGVTHTEPGPSNQGFEKKLAGDLSLNRRRTSRRWSLDRTADQGGQSYIFIRAGDRSGHLVRSREAAAGGRARRRSTWVCPSAFTPSRTMHGGEEWEEWVDWSAPAVGA